LESGLVLSIDNAALREYKKEAKRGTAGGITGVHEWTFSQTPSGVRMTTTESFAGEPVKVDTVGMQSALDASLASWLAHLDAAAESRT
jgi:hypothetical protein